MGSPEDGTGERAKAAAGAGRRGAPPSGLAGPGRPSPGQRASPRSSTICWAAPTPSQGHPRTHTAAGPFLGNRQTEEGPWCSWESEGTQLCTDLPGAAAGLSGGTAKVLWQGPDPGEPSKGRGVQDLPKAEPPQQRGTEGKQPRDVGEQMCAGDCLLGILTTQFCLFNKGGGPQNAGFPHFCTFRDLTSQQRPATLRPTWWPPCRRSGSGSRGHAGGLGTTPAGPDSADRLPMTGVTWRRTGETVEKQMSQAGHRGEGDPRKGSDWLEATR